jgi:hypothetical protein
VKYLANIVEKEEIKSYIDNNSEKVVDVVKDKFNVKELYSNIVENLDDFSNENIEVFYNNIKNHALNYTCEFLTNNSKKNLI